ncbi:LytTR family transcriptional regulator DNA-binding domain-containing protein [Tenacibaculum amylolyticum]|uniref:LytTR family transcriptional regulator DNA-binding domain-containing protein n=1 Tax=Tenacibaculum amylolyticum TaxID=104269 RepID=UPI003894A5EC
MKIKELLNIPLPLFNTRQEKWQYIISSTLFFVFFLLVYRPFGILDKSHAHGHSVTRYIMIVLIFAMIIFSILTLSQFIFRERFFVENRTIKYFIKWFLIDVLLIICFATFMVLLIFSEKIYSVEGFLSKIILRSIGMYFNISVVLLYPVMGTLIYNYIKQLHNDKKEIENDLELMNNHYKIASGNDDLVQIVDENNECKLTVPMNAIYAMESQNQYVSIQYLKNEKLCKQIIRTRFSKILKELEEIPSIIKCHRSYAVNLINIETLKNINQKPTLILGTFESIKVPVSKTYLKDVKTKLSLY